MTEREIFIDALDKGSPAERATFLDAACAGDAALRGRIEALLRSHEGAGEFLNGSAPERLAGVPGVGGLGDETRSGASQPDGDVPLDFLEPSDKPGSLGRLGHYEVREVVGRGGMGVVLKAFDESLHRVVAIKVMAPQLATSATARRRFAREARAAAAVTHDHVVTIHAVVEAGPLPHIVMQYVAGQSLQDRLDRTGPLSLPEVLRIGMQTASGLAAAHAQGLVHRDVKPANILLENGVERVKLTDFGLARAADDASLTQSGTVAGTPSFMSPEQAEGKPVDHRSDLFSLGSVLYALCTGRPPFRSGSNMGVLKRVCEDTPTPVREANPDIPDWLVELIGRLHAKDPAGRFQSAAEVAELLGQHLARVQRPSVALPPAVVKPADGPPGPVRRSHAGRRWAAAAAVLVTTLAVLGTTEATGVTNVRATVIRLFTPDGVLVVETDDPAVKVVVEGDGDLVITGAGPQEVRLRAGSYRLKATRDGKPVNLDRDLVTISRGDRQIVRVRLEGEPPAAVAPKAERGAVVLLGGKGVGERTFDTLAEAARASSSGDTIEVRGNGPFVSDGFTLRHPIVIRAGAGYAPVITLSKTSADRNIPLILTFASLVLEGLDLRRVGGAADVAEGRLPRLLRVSQAGALHVANCRLSFRTDPPHCQLFQADAAPVNLRNLVLTGNFASDSSWFYRAGGRYRIENCVSALGGFLFSPADPDARNAFVGIRANTLVGNCLNFTVRSKPNPPEVGDAPPVRLEISENVAKWDPSVLGFLFFHQAEFKETLSADQAQAILPRLVRLDEKRNVYQTGESLLRLGADWQYLPGKRGRDLADWNRFWGQKDTGSLAGNIRFQGGDLMARALSHPEGLTAEDFRLRADSAGYRAGPGGKDLGANIDLVGPGAAYERWKMTPDYQQWLKETGQKK